MNATLVQTNFRLDSAVKGELEQVLTRAGTTTTEYLRAVCEKASRGIRDYDEVMAVAAPRSTRLNQERTAQLLADMASNQQWYAEMAALRSLASDEASRIGPANAGRDVDAPSAAANTQGATEGARVETPGRAADVRIAMSGAQDKTTGSAAGARIETPATTADESTAPHGAGADLPPNAPALNPPIILMDTDLWLDLFLPNRPQREDVAELISLAQAQGIPLAFASQAALAVYQHVQDACARWWLDGPTVHGAAAPGAAAPDAARACAAPQPGQPHIGMSDPIGPKPSESPALPPAITQAIRAHAWDCVGMMQSYATAIPTDSSDLYLAYKLRGAHDDLGDDLVLAACRRARANYLVTRNEVLMAHATVCAKTPRDMLAVLDAWS